jgi:predicted RNA binding protein YcfA (HicA-like mRNA interferase family)
VILARAALEAPVVKASALYEKLQQSPGRPLRFRDFERLLAAFGFVCVRRRGSHRVFEHPDLPRPLIVQPHRNEAKAYQQQEFLDMVAAYDLGLLP